MIPQLYVAITSSTAPFAIQLPTAAVQKRLRHGQNLVDLIDNPLGGEKSGDKIRIGSGGPCESTSICRLCGEKRSLGCESEGAPLPTESLR